MRGLSRVIAIPLWPCAAAARAAAAWRAGRARPRRRPEVTGHFAVALISALAAAALLAGDLIRMELSPEQYLPFLAHHPLSYIGGACAVMLALLLAVGDV